MVGWREVVVGGGPNGFALENKTFLTFLPGWSLHIAYVDLHIVYIGSPFPSD